VNSDVKSMRFVLLRVMYGEKIIVHMVLSTTKRTLYVEPQSGTRSQSRTRSLIHLQTLRVLRITLLYILSRPEGNVDSGRKDQGQCVQGV